MKLILSRSKITKILGILWLIDGLLQLQHQMFTSSFTSNVIDLAAQGQPKFVVFPVHLFVRFFLTNPILFNGISAAAQLIIGVLILNKKYSRIGLIASILWGLFVWAIGESYSSLFNGHALIMMGAPGAVFIYVILALAVLPSKSKDDLSSQSPPFWLAYAWALFWIGGAVYQMLPGQNSVSALSAMISSNASGQPGWLASLDYNVANKIDGFGKYIHATSNMHMTSQQMSMMQIHSGSGGWFIVLLVLIQLFIGLAVFLPKLYRNYVIVLSFILVSIYWFVGQSLGGIFTGLATDPNAAPLYIILGLAVMSIDNLKSKTYLLLDKFEKKLN